MASYLLGIPVGSAINRIGLLKSPHWSQLHHHCQDCTVKKRKITDPERDWPNYDGRAPLLILLRKLLKSN